MGRVDQQVEPVLFQAVPVEPPRDRPRARCRRTERPPSERPVPSPPGDGTTSRCAAAAAERLRQGPERPLAGRPAALRATTARQRHHRTPRRSPATALLPGSDRHPGPQWAGRVGTRRAPRPPAPLCLPPTGPSARPRLGGCPPRRVVPAGQDAMPGIGPEPGVFDVAPAVDLAEHRPERRLRAAQPLFQRPARDRTPLSWRGSA